MDSIFVIDDEKDNLDALRRLLRSDFDVHVTSSPIEALKTIQAQEFAVIVSDQRMPEMNGVDLLEKAKTISPYSSRVLLTGYTDVSAVIDAINRGNIYRYIAKPWDPAELRITLKQAAEAYRLKKELEQKNFALGKANDQLKEAYEDLRLLDRAKARFLSLISHELNTPLTVIQAFAELLFQNKGSLPEEVQQAIQSLKAASSRFSDIVTEVLLYTRLEGEESFRSMDFDLKEKTESILKANKATLREKGLSLNTVASENTRFRGDPEKLGTAIEKLIHDTLERIPQESELKIAIQVTDAHAKFSIWRMGEVITNDAFEPLEATKDELHHHRGLGLSLAICRLIVEGHGGQLAFESNDNTGTEITLSIPSR